MNTEPRADEGRRSFLKQTTFLAAALPAWLVAGRFCGPQAAVPGVSAGAGAQAVRVGGYCEGCEAAHMGRPREVASSVRLAPEGEPGEPLEMRGRVLRADGKTPAPGVVLYLYHTDAGGLYSPAPGAEGFVRRHGHLRGWVRTDARGEYAFRTVRPAAYPGRDEPAHVHVIVLEPGLNEYYIDDYVFDDDPLLTAAKRTRLRGQGGSGVITLTRSEGVWKGTRDIVLGLNVSGYPRA